ncbi:NAD(P)H-dependent oxidoreductase [Companilactobacillus bobalius]|uniref:Fumarate reductase (Quinol) n=2 Tax=Companilactobacillus bobalius TaxID=2801451 RepID=A0A202FCM3_9LACO|nr:NAD(P)H-dependent oxidoreductase [Companilactobacillus bobalius]GEO58527.1 FMN reductase [Companilactobacillus paralimentarius]KAE9557532.1 NADPH-dependent FMN reductase [Companilactobacillus bobalius]KAE9561603.1 NADPH-dependent FMN reductase [Companilactobacillus bobalius]KAE9563679.1 NADPH-dependent FMN reductase [Companilactobacillus bobalius]KRK82506.1 flavoprotein [Companilactobacillus bobalius DSM 19674]
MKLVGIAGSIADQSYNRTLLNFIAKHCEGVVDIEVLDINQVPMFSQDDDQTNSSVIQKLSNKVKSADGVIIATPGHNHTVPAALKNVIEWLSYEIHPFDGKPVMIVGASYHTQGSSRAQLHLRQILEAPGVNAVVLPGNEFLLGNVKTAFDDNGELKDQRTVDFLDTTLQKFIKFAKVINMIDADDYEKEDLSASGKVDTTVEGVDMDDPDWINKAAEKVNAVDGDTYVKLDSGLLTVNQLNYMLKTTPIELTYVDENNQFIYYNRFLPTEKMLAKRTPAQVGDSLTAVHPGKARVIKHVKQVIHMLRSGKTDLVSMPVPGGDSDHHVMHYYKAMHDEEGNYKGVNEWAVDLKPIVNEYLKQTGQMLVPDPNAKVDATSGASEKSETSVDATASASKEEAEEVKPEVDATSSASKH